MKILMYICVLLKKKLCFKFRIDKILEIFELWTGYITGYDVQKLAIQ
jgi:hypothetical protein